MPKGVVPEDVNNAELAKLLRKEGLQAESLASAAGGKQIDVSLEVDGVRVAIEAKNSNKKSADSVARQNAVSDATMRLSNNLADVGIGVVYPPIGTPSPGNLDNDTLIDVCVAGGGREFWFDATASDLAHIIRVTAKRVGDVNAVAASVQRELKRIVGSLAAKDLKPLAKLAFLPSNKTSAAVRASATQTLLVIFAASLFHTRLGNGNVLTAAHKPQFDARQTGSQVPYTGSWPPATIANCLSGGNLKGDLRTAWKTILAKDYTPIFQDALTVLNALPANQPMSVALEDTVKKAEWAAGKLVTSNSDLLGRLFHWSVSSAKHEGTYYTKAVSASMLTGLAIPADAAEKQDFTIIDPACGTGTLLAASAETILGHNFASSGVWATAKLIEDVLRGWDVNPTAAHMTAVTLGMIAPEVTFTKMGIYSLALGVSGGAASLGSLEYLRGMMQQTSIGNTPQQQSSHVDTKKAIDPDVTYDMVIMNPPFTSAKKRYKHLPKVTQDALKDREETLLAGKPVDREHLGGPFLYLGDKLLGDTGTTLAFVYPASGTSSPTMDDTWEYLFDRYYMEWCVYSHDTRTLEGGNTAWAFSENTGISEILCVMRRKDRNGETSPDAKFVALRALPDNPIDAYIISYFLSQDKTYGLQGHITKWSQHKLKAGDWTPIKFYSKYLVDIHTTWFSDEQKFEPLEKQATVGPNPRGNRGAFTLEKNQDKQAISAIWFNDQEAPGKLQGKPDWHPHGKPTKIKMEVSHDGYAKPKSDKQSIAQKLSKNVASLFIPELVALQSCKTTALRTTKPVLSSQWTPIRKTSTQANATETDTVETHIIWEKSMCVYLNSTIGVIATIGKANQGILARRAFPTTAQKQIPVPKNLDATQLANLAQIYDQHKNTPLDKLNNPNSAPRIDFDKAITQALGLNKQEVEKARHELAKEPATQ